ncbi:IclR family transcriptional regulator C-terminal domain-containing protein, partial [Methylobacterium nigriterrae]
PEQRSHYLTMTDFKPVTPHTITDPRAFDLELNRVNTQGYAWVDGELDPAICGIAVPVRDHSNAVVAAVSINTISGTVTEEEAKQRYLVAL